MKRELCSPDPMNPLSLLENSAMLKEREGQQRPVHAAGTEVRFSPTSRDKANADSFLIALQPRTSGSFASVVLETRNILSVCAPQGSK